MENEGVLLDLDRGLYFHLNATGVAIWQGLETGISLGELHARLVGEYAADCDRVWSELESLIRALLAENLLGALES